MNKKCSNTGIVLFIILQVGLTIASPTHKRNFHPKSKPSEIAQELNSQTIKILEELLDTDYQNNDGDDISLNENDLVLDSENVDSTLDSHLTKRHPLLFDWTTSCGDCDSNLCEPPPEDCPSGLIRDACDCCYVCGNLEDSACDLDGEEFRFGFCGKDLICVPVSPRRSGSANAYCTCASSRVICGNDGKTYSNPCQFKRTTGRKAGLRKSHDGPCIAAPLVEIPPMNQTVESDGGSAVFSCSVSGYPLAWFEWLFDGENVFKPGLSGGISVQIREGPLQYQVTTWLEIERVAFRHSGVYTCLAKNVHGSSNASARLDVIEGDFAESRPHEYFYRGSTYDFGKAATEMKQEEMTIPLNYLESHTLPGSESNSGLAYLESANQNLEDSIFDQTRVSTEKNNVRNGLDSKDVFIEALKELVKPKPFKDIFFDDDDFSDGSGSDIN